MTFLVQFCIGLLFGSGLVVAGMSDPAKVLNFLDIAAIATGGWDLSLAFVMAGGVVVTFIGYRLVQKQPHPLFDRTFHLPKAKQVDARVIAGPAMFGIGWGLAGFCPGPALTALGTGSTQAIIFAAAMLAGMLAARTMLAPHAPLPANAVET
jgi:uncharacterized protein